jgi:hypothetical protein
MSVGSLDSAMFTTKASLPTRLNLGTDSLVTIALASELQPHQHIFMS